MSCWPAARPPQLDIVETCYGTLRGRALEGDGRRRCFLTVRRLIYFIPRPREERRWSIQGRGWCHPEQPITVRIDLRPAASTISASERRILQPT
jgi:hypothetical protein